MEEGSHYSGSTSPRRKPTTWHGLQVLGVCTCLVGYRIFDAFPAKVLKYSGVFFIPYYAGLLIIVLPVLYVQLKLGGATRSNMVALFSRYIPVLKGIGIACVIRMFIFNIYFNVIVSYLAYFAIASLSAPFPWSTCNNSWNDNTCTNDTSAILTGKGLPEQQYFDNHVLELSADISQEGDLRWPLGIALLGVWGLTFIMVAGGVRVFAWFAALFGNFAIVTSVALLAYSREELLHQMPETVLYKIDWEQLVKPDAITAFLSVWMDGMLEGVTIIYLWQGLLPTIGKYASHGSSCRMNGMWVVFFIFICAVPHLIINLVAWFLNPLVAMSGTTLQSLLESGPRMLFVLFPAAFHQLGLGRGVAFVFYLMVLLLLANTQALFAMVAIENIGDGLKTVCRCCRYRIPRGLFISALYCGAGLLLGVPMITQGGYYFLQLVYLWLDRLLCVVVFLSMIGYTESYAKQPFELCHRVFMLIWFLLASLFTTAITMYTAKLHLEPTPTTTTVRHGVTYTYPSWAYIIGWFIAGGPIFLGLLYGVIHACALTRGRKDGCLTACTGRVQEDEEYLDIPDNRPSRYSDASLEIPNKQQYQYSDASLNRRSQHSNASSAYLKPEQY